MSLYSNRGNEYFKDNVNYTHVILGVVTEHTSIVSYFWGMSLRHDRHSNNTERYCAPLPLTVNDRIIKSFNDWNRDVIYEK